MTTGKIRSVISVRDKGIIMEANTDSIAIWLAQVENQKKICDKIDPSVNFKARSFTVIALNAPTDMDPKNPSHLAEICEANNLATDQQPITSANWAKVIENRSITQCTAHLYLTFNNAEIANRAITYGLLICNKKCSIEKRRKEPTRCLKCQGWNHIAKDCIETTDTCGSCAGQHRTDTCKSKEKKCASCKTDDHTSWSRQCPTFLKKLADLNNRSLENSTIYFPTNEPWTWTPKREILPTPSAAAILNNNTTQYRQTNNHPNHNVRITHKTNAFTRNPHRKQAPPHRQIDTYFPRYTQDQSQTQHDPSEIEQRKWNDYWNAANPNPEPAQNQQNLTGPSTAPNQLSTTNSQNTPSPITNA